MKKTYSKPQIVYECFEMSQSIATGCEFKSHFGKAACSVDTKMGFTIYMTIGVCDETNPKDDNKPCYDVPGDYTRVFSS